MRVTLFTFLAIGSIAAAMPARAQTYDPRYPVCLQTFGPFQGIDCSYTSMQQCKFATGIRASQCIVNPYYARVKRSPGGGRWHPPSGTGHASSTATWPQQQPFR